MQTTLSPQSRTYRLWIDGQWSEAAGGKRFERESPAHDVKVGEYAQADVMDVDRAVASARRAFDAGLWRNTSGEERQSLLLKVAAAIREQAGDLALIETLESGKPIRQAREEMQWAAGIWDYAATLARHSYGDVFNTLGENALAMTLREPLGVVAMITPWNFPLLIISQKLPFALAMGCSAVIKPSELTPGTTLLLGQMLKDAGLPDGVVNIVTGYGDPVGRRLAEHPDVDMVSFTGSTAVGKLVAGLAQSNLKRVELELGGKNPQIIFPDADLEAALDAAVFGVYFNMGECCNSGSRLLIHRDIAEEFTARLIERARTVPVGDPLDEQTKVGAIINQKQFDKIMDCIASGRQQGARVRLGGERHTSPAGRFIQATVFTDVKPEMRIACEEIFGPVLSVLTFGTPDEAMALANRSMYGLSAAVWTRDVDTAFHFARGLRAGTVWVNTFMEGSPELPFGGFNQSGVGRELGRQAIETFTELKTVQLHLGPRTGWWHRP